MAVKINEVVMFTSEIAAAEINTLRDEGITLVIPSDLEVDLVTHHQNLTYVHISRRKA